MNKYIYLNNLNVVWEILDEFSPDFPNIPIQNRYSKEFLNQCLIIDEEEFNSLNITLNMIYNKETNTFSYPELFVPSKKEDNILEEKQEEILEKEASE